MAEHFLGLSGEGEVTFSSGGNIGLIGAVVQALPVGVAIMSGTTPRRMMNIGWISVAFPDDPEFGTGALVYASHISFIEFDQHAFWPDHVGIYGDRIIYSFQPGAIVDLHLNFR